MNTAQVIQPGSQFGRLTVLADSGKRTKDRHIIWTCQCECGNYIDLDRGKLLRGTVTSCGCAVRVRSYQRDIAGERFGMLTAEYCTGKKAENGSLIWHLKCDCGNTMEASLRDLTNGYCRSCGCQCDDELPMCANKVIQPGARFGRLTVISDSGKRTQNRHIIWRCRCDCGKYVDVDRGKLLRGTATSCGCAARMRPDQRDITGERFGTLTAEYCTGEKDENGSFIWHLKCDCGNTVEANLRQLVTGHCRSCGCQPDGNISMSAKQIQPGARFCRLTVIADSGRRTKDKHIIWTCQCDCGNSVDVESDRLLRGTAISCGCAVRVPPRQRDITGERFGMLTAEYCTGRKDTNGSFIWHLRCDCGNTVETNLRQLATGHCRSCGCRPDKRIYQ